MRRVVWVCVCVFFGLWMGGSAKGSILGLEELEVDFCGPQKSPAKVSWSPAGKIQWTAKGLGWDGHPTASWDGWIMSAPLAVGVSWRPTRSVNLDVSMEPTPKLLTLPNGQTYLPYGGQVFARFSPDKKYWSTWQPLQQTTKKTELVFRGRVGVPRLGSESYNKLVRAYMRRKDIPWRSDEEALVKSILRRKPHYFRIHKPFVGYVQVLWEGSFRGGQRWKRLKVRAVFAVSGLHYPPKEKRVQDQHRGPWRVVHPSLQRKLSR